MISKSTALFRRAKPFLPRHAPEKMYNTFVVPNFYYCSTLWYDGSISNLTKMLKLQKKAARVITGDPYDIRSNEVFRKLNWLPVNIHLQIREHIATFKALTGNSPACLTKLFIRCSNETYSLRSNYNELSLAKPHVKEFKNLEDITCTGVRSTFKESLPEQQVADEHFFEQFVATFSEKMSTTEERC